MSEEIDIENLITLVECRPALWNNAWKDLCEALDPTFKDMNDEDKNSLVSSCDLLLSIIF